MKVIFHNDFYQVYTADPAAAPGRMESVIDVIEKKVKLIDAVPASIEYITAVHSQKHIEHVRASGLYDISALAAGGAMQAAEIGLNEPSFALIRPPGHHASSDSAWGFCYFNNMSVALESLKRKGKINSAYVLDFDLHYGDGNVNILGDTDYVTVHNIDSHDRRAYLREVENEMNDCKEDIIGISAGFDNHREDWGGVMKTEDYEEIGRMVRAAAERNNGGCFGILEGGYNHDVLGYNVMALIKGMSEK